MAGGSHTGAGTGSGRQAARPDGLAGRQAERPTGQQADGPGGDILPEVYQMKTMKWVLTGLVVAAALMFAGCRSQVYYGEDDYYGPDYEDGVVLAPYSPPPPEAEVVPLCPGPDFFWIAGGWFWADHWVWHHGYWGHRPYAGATYVHPYWGPSHAGHDSHDSHDNHDNHAGHGYTYHRGYWHR